METFPIADLDRIFVTFSSAAAEVISISVQTFLGQTYLPTNISNDVHTFGSELILTRNEVKCGQIRRIHIQNIDISQAFIE